MPALPGQHHSVQGRCLCGAVAYRIEPADCAAVHCHCSMCRKHHGGSFATFIAVPQLQFSWLAGERLVRHYASSSHGQRCFCGICGAAVPVLRDDLDLAIVPMGGLSADAGVRAQAHWFVGSKAPWISIGDALIQHEEFPPEYEVVDTCQTPARPVSAANGGSCLCGAIGFELYGTPIRAVHCHCSRCRCSRAAAFATNAIHALQDLRFLHEDAPLIEYRLPQARFFGTSFCSRCGSLLPRRSPERELAVVPMGALDGVPSFRPQAHIHVASKAPWYDIDDDLPQYAGPPPA